MRFEWDDAKAQANLAKHGVSFGEATEVFYDPNGLEDYDAEYSETESRFFIIGLSSPASSVRDICRAVEGYDSHHFSAESRPSGATNL